MPTNQDLKPGDKFQAYPAKAGRIKRWLLGRPLEISDRTLFHRLSLIPFLAWVGLGADGLSSSAYGPDEAFRVLGEHTYLAIGLAGMILLTIIIISAAYSKLIEAFPTGGGGYIVASRLLGEKAGLLSGSALVVDYVLTITVSIAAAGDALFSFLPMHYHTLKFPVEIALICGLTVVNIRGVKESVMMLLPIFIVFLITHIVLIGGSLMMHVGQLPQVAHEVHSGFKTNLAVPGFGLAGMGLLFMRAYSLGGGTFTGLEAVSNGLSIMREPRVQTGRRTMFYMASSLAFCACGLLVCYLLLAIRPMEGKTMNAVLAQMFTHQLGWPFMFALVTLIAEGALLVVAAQAGFIDGPRVLGNMAVDSWFPRQFSALSDRLTTQNGILLMSAGALAALTYTHGDVRHLVVMYSINVFLTFTLSMVAMLKYTLRRRVEDTKWLRSAALFTIGAVLCASILTLTVYEKFVEGGWVTLVVTGGLVGLCLLIRSHYDGIGKRLQRINAVLHVDETQVPEKAHTELVLDPHKRTAAVLVGGYGGTGIHMIYNLLRTFPGIYHNFVFLSVGQLDSGKFKGENELISLRDGTKKHLERYVELVHRLGFPAEYRLGISADVVEEAERLCLEIARDYPQVTYFSGQLIFSHEAWYHRFLHNRTAFDIQKRLHWNQQTMVIIPMRVHAHD